jgi:hypothetical protein
MERHSEGVQGLYQAVAPRKKKKKKKKKKKVKPRFLLRDHNESTFLSRKLLAIAEKQVTLCCLLVPPLTS